MLRVGVSYCITEEADLMSIDETGTELADEDINRIFEISTTPANEIYLGEVINLIFYDEKKSR